jgi:hypothetical protein
MNQLTPVILILIFSVLLIHWVADFICQTDSMAQGKSKSISMLLLHTSTYTGIWFLAFIILSFGAIFSGHLNPEDLGIPVGLKIFWFLPITFICHTTTDYFTSRLNTKLWEKKDVHNFFVSIGWDQILHYVQLFLTIYYLTK